MKHVIWAGQVCDVMEESPSHLKLQFTNGTGTGECWVSRSAHLYFIKNPSSPSRFIAEIEKEMEESKRNVNDAGILLDAMRWEVESLLLQCVTFFGTRMPTCKSQSLRAARAIDLITEDIGRGIPANNRKQVERRMELIHIRSKLTTFLAVHGTVTLLERRQRCPDLDLFGNTRENPSR